MATSYPASLDSFTNPTAVDTLDSPPHDTQHADANDAIEALQAKVGVNGSAVTTSLDYKVANLESRPVETKTASYTLVAADVNKRIVMNSASATTITVNTGIFSAGDTVWIHNIGAGTTTVTAGTATVNTAGSLDVGQWEGGSLYFTSASSAIFFRGGGAGVANANFTDTETGTFTEGGVDYKYLIFTSSGTVTFDTDGIADFLVVGGGGGAGTHRDAVNTSGGGGAGGCLERLNFYITAGTYTVTIGAGGAGSLYYPWNAIGNDSSVGTLLQAVGGGGGGVGAGGDNAFNGSGAHGWAGGSGGGANQSPSAGIGGRGVSGQGTVGGTYNVGGGYGIGAGGGGWGGTGGPSGVAQPANGGPGDISTIVTSTIATTNSIGEVSGSDVYYGGGGAGKAKNATYDGTGGIGGGGDVATAGTANTGGGGGGSNTVNVVGASGGSGVVIVRVAV